MSDQSDLVQSDELQDEYESAQRSQSSRDAAVATAGIAHTKRIIRSYDGEVVGQDNPPPYSENTADVSSKDQQQLDQSYNQEQQMGARPMGLASRPTAVIRVPADCQVVRVIQRRPQSDVMCTRGYIWLTVFIIKLVIAAIVLIILFS